MNFDLFDDALAAAPLQAQAHKMAAEDPWVLEGGFEVEPSYDQERYPPFAVAHPTVTQIIADPLEDPEPALPVAYGDDEDPGRVAARLAAALPSTPPPAARESKEQKGRRLLAYADAAARGETPPGPNPFAHLLAGQADNEMASAAANFLATRSAGIQTEALKTYSPIERQAIIDEGEDVTAGNLDRLDIKGTHYEHLAATAKSEDEDLWMLDGDPNGFD